MSALDNFFAKLTQRERQSFAIHTLIAVFSIPLYLTVPTIYGLVIAPYLGFLVLRPQSHYLLPLIMHTAYGSQQIYVLLACCFLYSLLHISEFQKKGVLPIYLIYLLGIPFFAWYTYYRFRVFGGGIGRGGTFEGLVYYFAFAPFFWAMIAIKRLDKHFFYGLIGFSFFFVLQGFLGIGRTQDADELAALVGTFSRFYSWGAPFLFIVFVWTCLTRTKTSIKLISGLGALLFSLGFLKIGGALVPFHLMGTALFGSLLLVVNRIFPKLLICLHPWIFLGFATLSVFSATTKFENREIDMSGLGDYDKNNKIRNLSTLKNRIYFKLYGDRAAVWTASFDAVRRQTARSWFFVDVSPTFGEIYTEKGEYKLIEIQAHNLLLELLRLYGAYGGGICLIVFFLIAKKRQIYHVRRMFATPVAPILACAVGHIIFGYWGGQYLVARNFSFALFGLLGVGYSLNKQGLPNIGAILDKGR